jgi:hypothetical protein
MMKAMEIIFNEFAKSLDRKSALDSIVGLTDEPDCTISVQQEKNFNRTAIARAERDLFGQ